jgi:hypothetical protein
LRAFSMVCSCWNEMHAGERCMAHFSSGRGRA